MTTLSDFTVRRLDGTEESLSAYAGKVAVVVNTASNCGFAPQFGGLEALWQEYGDRGLVVLGFPCNQFAHQEPNDAEGIATVCSRDHGVTFPMFAKIDVNGADAAPLYRWLRSQKGGLLGDRIKWNFTKFLIGRDGEVRQRFAPATKPEKLRGAIESALA
jgi:glutathione peroxidase